MFRLNAPCRAVSLFLSAAVWVTALSACGGAPAQRFVGGALSPNAGVGGEGLVDRVLFGSDGFLLSGDGASADLAQMQTLHGSLSLMDFASAGQSGRIIWQVWSPSGHSTQGSRGLQLAQSWDLTPQHDSLVESGGGAVPAVAGLRSASAVRLRGIPRRVSALPDLVSIFPGWDCPVRPIIQSLAQLWSGPSHSFVSGSVSLLMPSADHLRAQGCLWVPALNCLSVGTAALSPSAGGVPAPTDLLGGLNGRAVLADACGRATWFRQSSQIGRVFDKQEQGFVFFPDRVFSILIYESPAASLAEALLSGPPVASFPPVPGCSDPLGRCLVSPVSLHACQGCAALELGQRYWVYLVEAPGQLNESTLPIEIAVSSNF
jgi:hypothetical protein